MARVELKVRFSVRQAVAAHLNEDEAGIEGHRRYQPTRTPCPVYTVGNDYLTATSGTRKPPEASDNRFGYWRWVEIPTHGFAAAMGWRIWQRAEQSDG